MTHTALIALAIVAVAHAGPDQPEAPTPVSADLPPPAEKAILTPSTTTPEPALHSAFSVAPAYLRFQDALGGTSTAGAWGTSLQVLTCAVVDEHWQFGAALAFRFSHDVFFADTPYAPSAESLYIGEFYEDVYVLELGPLARYRHSLGTPLVPFAQLQLGAAMTRYSNLGHFPYDIELELLPRGRTELATVVTLQFGAEYRFGRRWVASLGFAFRLLPYSRSPLVLELPASVGLFWQMPTE